MHVLRVGAFLVLVSALSTGLVAAPARADVAAPARADVATPAPGEFDRYAGELAALLVREAPALRSFLGGVGSRARRSVAVGPSVGVVGGLPGEGDVGIDGAVSAGLAVYAFKVPLVPSFDDLRAVLVDQLKRELLRSWQQEPPVDAAGREAVARRIGSRIIDEFVATHRRGGRLIERPLAGVAVDVLRRLRTPDWRVRTTVWLGVSRASVGVALTAHDVSSAPSLGVDLAVHLTPNRAPRAAVYDAYVTVDWPLGDARERETWVGLRAVLDLI